MSKPVVVWFRQDLRLHDNPAFSAAAALDRPLIALYILDPALFLGEASKWWLHYSLLHLQEKLAALGIPLFLKHGPSDIVLQEILHHTQADTVFWNRRYDLPGITIDTALKKKLTEEGITCSSYNSHLLFEPWTIKTKQGTPFQVFTPFWKSCLNAPLPAAPCPLPSTIRGYEGQGSRVEELQLLPSIDWAAGLRDAWKPGEDHALERFYQFLETALQEYKNQRNYPGKRGTSGLSPHLMWGEISPRLLYHGIRQELVDLPAITQGAETFLTELGWREFSYYLLYHFPDLPSKPLRDKFSSFPWASDQSLFTAWKKGRTGYPIIDAGMRQLWHTGWMHNRVRMIVASFLVKDLLISWQQGAEWFLDTLVDADQASNSANWQWVAGCGTDAAPYFRIFNPVLQGEKFDPSGEYIYQWVPELKQLPLRWLHQPWAAPKAELVKARIELGTTYPVPIIDHDKARHRALSIFKNLG